MRSAQTLPPSWASGSGRDGRVAPWGAGPDGEGQARVRSIPSGDAEGQVLTLESFGSAQTLMSGRTPWTVCASAMRSAQTLPPSWGRVRNAMVALHPEERVPTLRATPKIGALPP